MEAGGRPIAGPSSASFEDSLEKSNKCTDSLMKHILYSLDSDL